MNLADPNIQRVELVAAALGDLRAELVLVGGCAASLLIDAPTAPPPRVTFDVDLMPTDETVLGFSNRWYPLAAVSAARLILPSGTEINLVSAPAFLATKFEAFLTRGQGDPLMSHDLEDIINVVEGRLAIEAEIIASEPGLRVYLAAQFAGLAAMPGFQNVLPGLVTYDDLHSRRVGAVMKKILAIAALILP